MVMNLTVKVVKRKSGRTIYITRNDKVYVATKGMDGSLHLRSSRTLGKEIDSDTVSVSLSKEEADIIRKTLGD